MIDGNFGSVFAAVLFSKVNENGDNMKGVNKCNDLAQIMEIDNKLYLRCHKLQGSFICCKQNYRL